MKITNLTPFTPFVFYSVDTRDREFGVALLRADFNLGSHGEFTPTKDPAEIAKTDVYIGEPGHSSIYYESDLAPFKPRSDILAHGDAIPLDGQPSSRWVVALRVGPIERSIQVTGPRLWRRRMTGWTLGPPARTDRVPLRYELAFGGCDATRTYHKNPLGRGHIAPTRDEELLGPQIEDPAIPIESPDGNYDPVGFGPITRSWHPRIGLAGTFDTRWRDERAPRLPLDFSFDHYNCAPGGLVAPSFLVGDEEVVAHGLGRPGRRAFRLPGLGTAIAGRLRDGREAIAPMFLDTLWIDFSRDLVRLTWRGSFAGRGVLTNLALMTKPALA